MMRQNLAHEASFFYRLARMFSFLGPALLFLKSATAGKTRRAVTTIQIVIIVIVIIVIVIAAYFLTNGFGVGPY